MNRRKLLFLTSRLPYPPIGGDRLKNYWLLKILSKHFNLHLVSIVEGNIPKEFFDWAKEIGISYKLFPKKKISFIVNTLKSIFNNLPLQVNYYYFRDVQNYVNSVYKEYDLLFATLIRTANYIINKEKPKILDMADSIGLNYLKSAEKTYSKFWKTIYSFESKRLLKFEKFCIEKFDKTLFFNKEEKNFFEKPDKTVWIPHGVDENLLYYDKNSPEYKNCIAFFGKMDYQPNIDAVLWFVNNVLPKVEKNLKFIIVGANPVKKILKLQEEFHNVKVTGFLDDPYLILKSALCIVAPMQTGGGIQNKILQTMALGTINIISSLAAKPIGGENMKHFIVEDNPNRMAKIINEIGSNPKKYEYIKQNAREFIKNNFTWSIYEKKIIEIIQEVLK